ncbi:MAG: tetratricopeptide repeat protein [Chloroflexota bacterium]|nr:tetratricopeptide repeat protein [Chloroflexota bacterium]
MEILLWLRSWWQRGMAHWHYALGEVHCYRGNATGEERSYQLAVASYARALECDPTWAEVHLARGVLFWRELHVPRQALDELHAALRLDPGLHVALFNRGVAYQQLGDYERAVADFRAYLAVGDDPHWREYAAKMLEVLG